MVPRHSIAREISARKQFVRSRITWRPKRSEVKDLLDFMHGFPAAVAACSQCGVLLRDETRVRDAGSYEEDPNDPDLMRAVLPRYIEAFAKKREAYEPLLRARAEILEIGPHLGAFLQVAEEWNWRPVGLDVGRDTTQFVRSLGLKTEQGAIEEAHFGPNKYDGIFIWNCFEQLADPKPALRAAHSFLKRHGILVARVPNALFYEATRDRHALAYNNLLGWPYLYGYTPEALARLMGAHGFDYLRGFNSELVTMPFPEITDRIAREQPLVSEHVAAWSRTTTQEHGTLTGPWIEMVFRKVDQPVRIQRLSRRRIDLRFLRRAA